MKKILVLVLVFAFVKCYSQTNNLDSIKLYEKNRKDWSPYGYDKSTLLINLVNNNYTTQITYFDFNFVLERVQAFMNQLGFASNGGSEFDDKNKTVSFSYSPSYNMSGPKNKTLHLKFHYFFNNEKNMIIDGCKIYGDYRLIVNFYVNFWNTNINIETSKNKIAYNSFWQDKITLSQINPNGTGTISIVNNTIKSVSEYETKLKDAIINPTSIKQSTPQKDDNNSSEKVTSNKANVVTFEEQTFYSQTDNLLILDNPSGNFYIQGFLHKGAIVRSVDDRENKTKSKNYMYVKILYKENNCGLDGNGIMGWVMKKYLSKNIITDDKYFQKIETVSMVPYAGDMAHDPNRNMWKRYPFPKYKGGKEN